MLRSQTVEKREGVGDLHGKWSGPCIVWQHSVRSAWVKSFASTVDSRHESPFSSDTCVHIFTFDMLPRSSPVTIER